MKIEIIEDLDKITEHPLLDVFPPPPDDQYDFLLSDIKRHGVREPLALDRRERLIDGRTRLRICRELGITPEFITYPLQDDDQILDFMVSRNLARRHLDVSQRAAIAAEIATRLRGGDQSAKLPNAISQAAAAKLMNVSVRSVGKAVKIKKASPALLAAVKDNTISLAQANHLVDEQQRGRDKVVVKAQAPDAPSDRSKAKTHDTNNTGRKPKSKAAKQVYPAVYGNLFSDLAELNDMLATHPLSLVQAEGLKELVTTAMAALDDHIARVDNADRTSTD